MSRYIDAEHFKHYLNGYFTYINDKHGAEVEMIDKSFLFQAIDNEPTADVVEVVRCGECRKLHHEFKKTYCPLVDTWDINPQWYCADGERREDGKIH